MIPPQQQQQRRPLSAPTQNLRSSPQQHRSQHQQHSHPSIMSTRQHHPNYYHQQQQQQQKQQQQQIKTTTPMTTPYSELLERNDKLILELVRLRCEYRLLQEKFQAISIQKLLIQKEQNHSYSHRNKQNKEVSTQTQSEEEMNKKEEEEEVAEEEKKKEERNTSLKEKEMQEKKKKSREVKREPMVTPTTIEAKERPTRRPIREEKLATAAATAEIETIEEKKEEIMRELIHQPMKVRTPEQFIERKKQKKEKKNKGEEKEEEEEEKPMKMKKKEEEEDEQEVEMPKTAIKRRKLQKKKSNLNPIIPAKSPEEIIIKTPSVSDISISTPIYPEHLTFEGVDEPQRPVISPTHPVVTTPLSSTLFSPSFHNRSSRRIKQPVSYREPSLLVKVRKGFEFFKFEKLEK